MPTDGPFLPDNTHIPIVTRDTPPEPGVHVVCTRDPAVIEAWARMLGAEPATGQATESGPASSMSVADGGSGLRFNYPGFGRFRNIAWSEWFDHFNRHDLTFVFEPPEGDEAPSGRYRMVRTVDLQS
ncbi:MAG TPA: hypothetical protein VH740_04975 [Vicinamibacterales bacterium]|jgi:hypothetical protein